MSMSQAAHVRAPTDAGSDEYGVLKFTAGTTSAANAIPKEWHGRYVTIYATGDDVHFGFSADSSAEIDSGVTATAAGASTAVGGILPNGLMYQRHVMVPGLRANQKVYFVRETPTGSATVYMELSS